VQGSAWLIDTEITITPDSRMPRRTPTDALHSAAALAIRLSDQVRRIGSNEGTILLTEPTIKHLRLDEPQAENGFQPAKAALEQQGWRVFGNGPWWTWKAHTGIELHVGAVDVLDRREGGWSFRHDWWSVTVATVAQWQTLTGYAWQNDPAVMGIELIHKTIRPWRIPKVTGNQAVVKRQDKMPTAGESPFLPADFHNPQKGRFLHQFDRRRAGISACETAKVAPGALEPGWRKFDGKRAGLWLIEIPAWNLKELPHPCGPYKVGSLQWVTTPTMDLLAELAGEGLVSMPDVRDSWTNWSRPVLQPFKRLLEQTYQTAVANTATLGLKTTGHDLIAGAVKEVGNAGIGMLGNPDSSFYRPDFMAAVNANKRCGHFRAMWRVGNQIGMYPVRVDDDAAWYASDNPDPASVPGVPRGDAPGLYHPKQTVDLEGE
jgi:hypothetical protein